MQSEIQSVENVDISVELDGPYDEIVAILGRPESEDPELGPLVADLATVLETVERINGGTRSRIASHLPDDMGVPVDAEEVVALLRVLERYDLVQLDGNTWRVGPAAERA